jgi:YVTN family beta-propeller protein
VDRSLLGFGLGFSSRPRRGWFLALGFGVASALSTAPAQATLCGGVAYPFPYTDVAGVGAPFCPGIMEAYVTGVSKGTTPTTFSPNNTVTRVQMTTFLQRSLDQGLTRESRRAALNQWATPQNLAATQTVPMAGTPLFCAADGENIWVSTNGTVVQVQASTGKVLGTWTGATNSWGVVVAAGKVFAEGANSPGTLYVIDPTLPPGLVTVSTNPLGNLPKGIAFDGTNLWTANSGASVSIISPQSPYTVTPVTTGFVIPAGILYDGANIWVADFAAAKLLKLNAAGVVVQSVTVGAGAQYPVFDGANIWVPNQSDNSITVVQASTGAIVATLSADATNLLNQPIAASFDGERILVTNLGGSSVTVFKAADLSFIANVPTGALPVGACSDGINFWVSNSTGLMRF